MKLTFRMASLSRSLYYSDLKNTLAYLLGWYGEHHVLGTSVPPGGGQIESVGADRSRSFTD
jgi:hypothetical protein